MASLGALHWLANIIIILNRHMPTFGRHVPRLDRRDRDRRVTSPGEKIPDIPLFRNLHALRARKKADNLKIISQILEATQVGYTLHQTASAQNT